jgi:small-conductance mechanosensitive channel
MITILLNLITGIDTKNAAAQASNNLDFTRLISQTVDKIIGWGKTGFHYLPNFVVAVIVLLIFYFIGKLIRKLVSRFLHSITDNHTVVDLVETVIGVVLIIVGIFLALSIVNLSGIVTTLLAGVGIIGLALGFAFRDIAANFISGVILSIRQPFKKNDIIESEGHFGTVQKINLRCTIIRTMPGQMVYIPNRHVLGKALINYTQTGERRVDVACRISYADDLEKAKRAAIEAVKTLDNYNNKREVQFLYGEFGNFSINFKVRFWVYYRKNMDYLSARSDAIVAIAKKFDEENLKIPFPIRTQDYGIRGGEKLSDMLSNGGAKGNKVMKE